MMTHVARNPSLRMNLRILPDERLERQLFVNLFRAKWSLRQESAQFLNILNVIRESGFQTPGANQTHPLTKQAFAPTENCYPPSLTATPHAHPSKTVTRKARGHLALVSYIPLNKSL